MPPFMRRRAIPDVDQAGPHGGEEETDVKAKSKKGKRAAKAPKRAPRRPWGRAPGNLCGELFHLKARRVAPGSMEFHRVIGARRACARSPTSVETEKIERMLEAARWSPSCANRQPWRFVVVGADAPSARRSRKLDAATPGRSALRC